MLATDLFGTYKLLEHQGSIHEFYMLENRLRCFSLEKLPLFVFVLKLFGGGVVFPWEVLFFS